MPVRCLAFHASYRCRHSGACCSTEWDIPVEARILAAVTSGRLAPIYTTPAPFERRDATSGPRVLALARTPQGTCGFRHQDRCTLHAEGGEAMLPSACRHFPRVFLHDARGTLVTLSHFCPTAADLLLGDGDIAIVEAAPPLALDEPLEGLDARDALPPLLRPGMLMDATGVDAWERNVVQTFAESACAERAFAAVHAATECLRGWSPSDGALASAAAAAFQRGASGRGPLALSKGFEIVTQLTGPHPALEVPRGFQTAWASAARGGGAMLQRAIARYLAAAVFGNWIAYRGTGLRSVLEWLRASYDVLRIQIVRGLADGRLTRGRLVEAFRTSDFIMVHTVDSQAFGRAVASVER